jgi:hypothetical protein
MPLDSEISIVVAQRMAAPVSEAVDIYQSLPLCVTDAVLIGVSYDSTRQVVIRYCQHTSQRRIRQSDEMPQRSEQEALSTFRSRPERADTTLMLSASTRNDNAPPRGGILKAEAALRFAQTLRSFGVEHLQDVANVMANDALRRDFAQSQGKPAASPCSTSDCRLGRLAKPDRMVRS